MVRGAPPLNLNMSTKQSFLPTTNISRGGRRQQPTQKWRASTIQCLLLSTVLFTLLLWTTLSLFSLQYGNEDDIDIASASASSPVANHNIPTPKATIAYAVSLTSCGNAHNGNGGGGHSSDPSFHEGAAVLKHSIHLASIRNYHQSQSVFDYEMIAFVHPTAESCSDIFHSLGYTVQIRDTPFNVTDVKMKFLRENVVKSGCCGEKEYLKLYAYALLDYPIVVHLDLDSLVLKPLDDLFLAMLGTNDNNGDDIAISGDRGGGGATDGAKFSTEVSEARSRIPVMFGNPLPVKSIDAYFTRDYNMINPGHKHVGVQGGFLVVKPSMEAFNEYVDIVLEGRFMKGAGWDGQYGGFFGAQQIQGICLYFYDARHPGTGVELNRCYYNNMADDPRQTSSGMCRDGRDDCQDCRDTPIEVVKSVHFTLCSKPWKCPSWHPGSICEKFHYEWFRIRADLERSLALQNGVEYKSPNGKFKPEVFHGYCKRSGGGGYIAMGP